jgi:hypothetical protein
LLPHPGLVNPVCQPGAGFESAKGTAAAPLVTLQELPEIRRKTEAISRHLHEQLKQHLETLRPLFAPERVFGRQVGGRSDVPGAERAVTELQRAYRDFSAKPFDLPVEFDPQWLTLVGNRLELHAWEYNHTAQSGTDSKPITMTNPMTWILSYGSNYSVAQAKQVLAGKEQRRPEYLRQFVVNALVMQVVVSRFPGLAQLFGDLRYNLKADVSPELPRLPLVTIVSCLPAFRPADDLILAATAFSGVPAFIELINLDEIKNPKDALKEKLEELAR